MNLTYEIINNGKGYMIKNNGVNWIKQDVHIPYPGSTIEESAQNHIYELIKSNTPEAPQKSEIEEIRELLEEHEAALIELAETILGGNK